MKTITVKIGGNGKPEIKADGFTGGSCKLATKPLLDAFGATADNSENTDAPELHMFGGEDETENEFL